MKLLLLALIIIIAVGLYSESTIGQFIKVRDSGAIEYNFAHAIMSADSVAYTPTVAKDVYTKLVPGSACHEADYITCQGDTLTILTGFDGDYRIDISIRLSGANVNDAWRIKIYKNSLPQPTSVGRFVFRTTSAGEPDTRYFFWYLDDLVAGDDISFYITNLTASRNPTITDFKVYAEQKPE